eukprot:COSAG04_NODE_4226_length_2222_cov_2.234103_1_plen_319_part_10
MAVRLASRHEVGAGSVASTAEVGSIDFLIGTFTNKDSKGIYASSLDLATGALAPATLVAEALQPSWLRFHPAQQTVYSVNEDRDAPSCTAYRLLRDGGGGPLSLEKINTVSTGSAGPTHFSVSPSGKHLAVANYGGGALTVLPTGADGSLKAASALVQHEGSGPNEKRQSEPHAHSANFDRTGRFIFVCDLGTDELVVYTDPTPTHPPPRSPHVLQELLGQVRAAAVGQGLPPIRGPSQPRRRPTPSRGPPLPGRGLHERRARRHNLRLRFQRADGDADAKADGSDAAGGLRGAEWHLRDLTGREWDAFVLREPGVSSQ